MGRDHTGVAASDRIPAVLLLAGTACPPYSDMQLDFAALHLADGRPPYREKNKEPISSKLESSLHFFSACLNCLRTFYTA